ncbi:N-methyl-L-tryptophan oxidase [Acidobacterium sp. S8]|uniref:N-methyl-L-tryptophan oxidase n=1 Tax=Acidobacterium sp. S8 TaxID=1641854 RepID=UPI00131AEFA2|nr:N-methyl-L-tryptophan oxidase [Acidobacterium sp. S8]
MKTADVIVIGLGAMGSAAAMQLAERGVRVMGVDQFTPPHSLGSSHGLSRMYRQAYWEDPRYVPLLLRAFDQWQELGRRTGETLLHVTGGLVIGSKSGELVNRSLESVRRFGLPHILMDSVDLKRRYPVLTVQEDTVALLEENAGYVVPEAAIEHQLRLARAAGADIHLEERVLGWQIDGDFVTVRTQVETYSAGHLVITAGPWAAEVITELKLSLRVTRQVLYWFEPRANAAAFNDGKLPVYLFEAQPGESMVYGFPLIGPVSEGVKVALHGSTEICTAETIRREVDANDEQLIRKRLESTLPDLAGRLLHASTCLYTMTPDEHFILDRHPASERVTIAAGFSGHGFKFVPVIGEVLADFAMNGKTSWDLRLFALSRFHNA